MPPIKEQTGMFDAAIVFRCAALFHVLILFLTKSSLIVPLEVSYTLFVIAILHLATLVYLKNKIVANRNLVLIFLTIDIILAFALMTFGGGWKNAWYVYTFGTALMTAVFFKIPGALLASSFLGVIYLLSLNINGLSFGEMFFVPDMRDQIISNLISYMLGGAFFGYPAMLIQRLHEAKQELEEKNKKLQETDNIIRELRTNTEKVKEMISSILEPDAILKLLVLNQPPQEQKTQQSVPTGIDDQIITRRELELLTLIVKGKTNSEIANAIGISKRTVEAHRRNVFQKLGASSAAHATLIALRNNLINSESTNH